MVLKIVVTEEIDHFYKNVDKSYPFSISRGSLFFYDINNVSKFKLINNDKSYLIKDNEIKRNSSTNKYEIIFPKNLKCGKYSLFFTRSNDGIHKLNIYIFPQQLNKFHNKFSNQKLNLINDNFNELLNNYNNSQQVTEIESSNRLCINQESYDDYLSNMVKWIYNNSKGEKNKIAEILSCIGFLCYKSKDNSDIITYTTYNNKSEKIYNVAKNGKFNENSVNNSINLITQGSCSIDLSKLSNIDFSSCNLLELKICSKENSNNFYNDGIKDNYYTILKTNNNENKQEKNDFESFFNKIFIMKNKNLFGEDDDNDDKINLLDCLMNCNEDDDEDNNMDCDEDEDEDNEDNDDNDD